jgi:hypothetical protein
LFFGQRSGIWRSTKQIISPCPFFMSKSKCTTRYSRIFIPKYIFNAAIPCNPPLKSQKIMAQDSLVAPLISRFTGLKPECKFVVIKFPSLKTIVLKCLSYVSFKLIIYKVSPPKFGVTLSWILQALSMPYHEAPFPNVGCLFSWQILHILNFIGIIPPFLVIIYKLKFLVHFVLFPQFF